MRLPKQAKEKKELSWQPPMLATLVKEPFSDKNWIYETKFDGIRCLAFRKENKVKLYSRNKKLLNKTYPDLVKALEKEQKGSFIIDGEIVAFEGKLTSFKKLSRAKREKISVYFYLFDILYWKGYELTHLKLLERKKILKKAIHFTSKVRYTPHRLEKGERFFAEATKKGLEGVIAKKADSVYENGRSREWLKFKCVKKGTFFLIGFTSPKGKRVGFGALLLGFLSRGKLHYAGKVGTGYDTHLLHSLGKHLKQIERKTPPIKGEVKLQGVHWVEPKLQALIGFTEWTRDKKLRHPRFLSLKETKQSNTHD